MRRTRIMESLIGGRFIGSSKSEYIKEGYFWGMLDVFKSRRNTKRHPNVVLGKMQHKMWVYKDRNNLKHNDVYFIYKRRLKS